MTALLHKAAELGNSIDRELKFHLKMVGKEVENEWGKAKISTEQQASKTREEKRMSSIWLNHHCPQNKRQKEMKLMEQGILSASSKSFHDEHINLSLNVTTWNKIPWEVIKMC